MSSSVDSVSMVPRPSLVVAYTADEMHAHVQRIQQVMRAVMKEGTHFGKIPGAGDKLSLFKPGAEVLCVAFHIAPSYRINDLSDRDSARYRVTCIGTHQQSGIVLGEGMGAASSLEEKYKWRAAVCDEEFDGTDADRRRVKWKKGNPPYQVAQVRTEPADIENTVLKMACKRAQVAMAINVTGASDIFTQDLEDMPAELRDGEDGQPQPEQRTRGKPATQAPQARTAMNGGASGGGGGKCSVKQAAMLQKRLDGAGINERDFLEQFKVQAIADLPWQSVDAALQWITSARQ